jgi:hypothetical protein
MGGELLYRPRLLATEPEFPDRLLGHVGQVRRCGKRVQHGILFPEVRSESLRQPVQQ